MGPKKSGRRVRCGKCDGCLARECGKCKACVNMVRNGGPGTLRLPCQERKCLELLPPNKAEIERQKREQEEREKKEKEEKAATEAESKKKSASSKSQSQSKEKTGLTMITAIPPSGREYRSGLWRDPCGEIINYDVDGICAGCNGERDKEATEAGEAILLCDGKFCSREYHLKCAGLEAVPDTEFFCPQCCIMGTSKDLNNYFEIGESEKSMRGSSRAYVEGMLKEVLPTSTKVKSELPNYKQTHEKLLKQSSQPATSTSPTPPPKKPTHNLTPNSELNSIGEVFVGNSIRLFIPSDAGGVYHVGRIIDFRRHFKPFVATTEKRIKGTREEEEKWRELNGQEQEDLYGEGAYKELEFLVRFRAGTGGRKVPVHRWLVLEEHAVAVSSAVIWGKAPSNPWWPAQVICRSALEVAISEVSEEAEGICLANSKSKGVHTERVLVLFFGEQTNCELEVGKETANFLSPKFEEERDSQDNFLCVAVALAQVELEEQRRVKVWFNVKGQEADQGEAFVNSVAATANSSNPNSSNHKPSAQNANDMDLNDEIQRASDRRRIKDEFENSNNTPNRTNSNSDSDSSSDDNNNAMPSVPPVQSPFIAKGLHHTIVDVLTSDSTPGSKRKRLQSVKINKVNNDNVAAIQKSNRLKNGER